MVHPFIALIKENMVNIISLFFDKNILKRPIACQSENRGFQTNINYLKIYVVEWKNLVGHATG